MTPAERQERLLERIAIALEGIEKKLKPIKPASTVCRNCKGSGFVLVPTNDEAGFSSKSCHICKGTWKTTG